MLENLQPAIIWFLLGLVLLFSEFAIPAFILLFFGLGAWSTALAIKLGIAPNLEIQLVVFVLASLVTLFLFRNKVMHLILNKGADESIQARQIDSVAGGHAIVVEDITPGTHTGKVDFNGTLWQAISDEFIKKGTEVEVIDRINLTLNVKAVS